MVADPVIGDTVFGDYPNSHWLVGEIYSGLMKINDGSNTIVQPDLASSYVLSSSRRVYEFTLKQGLKFSDSSPVTASDFKWSWERALNPRSRSPRARDVLGSIEGSSAILDGSASELSGVVAVDDHVLKVTLNAPRDDFLALLSDPVTSVLKRGNVENWGVDWATVVHAALRPIEQPHHELPVGTGPFKLESVDYQNGPWVLKRNEHFHGRPPFLDGIEIITNFYVDGVAEGVARELAAFQNQNIDMMYPDPIDIDYQIIVVNGAPESVFLAFNPDVRPFDDVHFRRALVMATDLPNLDIHGGRITFALGILPPGFPGFREDLQPLTFDPVQAREELAFSRYADQEVAIGFNPLRRGFIEDEFQQISDSWSEILGIAAEYQPLDIRTFSDEFERGSLQIIGFQLMPAYPDPHAIFRVFNDPFNTGAESAEGVWIARKLDEANRESDAVKRLEIYGDLEQYLIDQALVLPIGWDTKVSYWSFQTWVNGFVWPKYGGSKFKDVWFDETAPKRKLLLP